MVTTRIGEHREKVMTPPSLNPSKDAEDAAHKKWTKEELEKLSPSQLREMLIESYKEELNHNLIDHEDVGFYAQIFHMKKEWPHRRQHEAVMLKTQIETLLSSEPDYEYWSRAAYWTAREACAILCEIDPDSLFRVHSLEELKKVSTHSSRLVKFFGLLRLLGREVGEQYLRLHERGNSQDLLAFGWVQLEVSFVSDWAKRCKFEVPEKLKIALEKFHADELVSDSVNSESRLSFEQKIGAYPEELRVAIEAFEAVSADPSTSTAPKRAILKWLDANKADLTKQAKERIAVVANWRPTGGAPKTPAGIDG